jgi:hypothetical protein
VEDGHRFLAQWGGDAEVFAWRARDLFGLHKPRENPHPSRRLSPYDETGLIWLLEGCEVVVLTPNAATIRCLSGSIIYRKGNMPARALDDNLDGLQ